MKNLRILCIIFLLLFFVSMHRAQSPAKSTYEESMDDLRLLRQSDGLHKLAIIHGGTYSRTMYGVPWVRHDSLSSLAIASLTILRVDVETNRCALVSDGKAIVTRYQVKIDDVYKGAFLPADTLSVALAGGKYRFSDGTYAQVDVPSQRRLLNGHQYILFLRNAGGGDYSPVGGDEGVFEISSSEDLIPFASGTNAPLQNERKFSVRQFADRVLEAVRQANESSR